MEVTSHNENLVSHDVVEVIGKRKVLILNPIDDLEGWKTAHLIFPNAKGATFIIGGDNTSLRLDLLKTKVGRRDKW